MSDVYDSAFRTLINDCSRLILPLINEAFGEHYTGNEEIIFFPNEHFISQQDESEQKRITDTNFTVVGEKRKNYHWECQSTSDSRMLVRLFEYDAQIALDQGENSLETLTVEFPNSAVLYLRNTKKTPESYRYVIKTPGGTVSYRIPIMKIKSYNLDEIFEKNLILLLPFYIFTFEADFAEYNTNEEKLLALKNEFQKIVDKLDELMKMELIGEFEKLTIIELTDSVVRALSARYEKVLQGVDNIMRGPIIETKAKKAWNEGKQQGIQLGKQQGIFSAYFDLIKSGLLSIKDAAAKLAMSEEELQNRMANFQM
ncbi:hypothetical protein [Treponema zioleckii]|uniref:hypothetical protein n=1 Tax=Treponema zioleckii TaxID=331680 RepID=UPI00168BCFDD|nr:hypothetical protein [Treponema zioleckii]